MTKNLKLITRDTQALTEVVGIVIMISIVILVATVLYVSMEQTSGSNYKKIPMVSMKQSGDQVVIIGVQFGEVIASDTTIKVIDSSGSSTASGTLQHSGTNLASGDTITFSGIEPKKAYTIQMIYMNNLIGIAEYLVR